MGIRERRRTAVLAVLWGTLAAVGASCAGSATVDSLSREDPAATIEMSALSTHPEEPEPEASPSVDRPGEAVTSSLPDATEGSRSAPATGDGVALLSDVRAGAGDGYERIVFEFAGATLPGYRVGWVDGPIRADGSGQSVEVKGDAYLEIVLKQASGVDPSSGIPSFDGPSRLEVSQQTELLTDLVRAGDFEAVLTWVVGTTEKSPFRVMTLNDPTRVVVDVARR